MTEKEKTEQKPEKPDSTSRNWYKDVTNRVPKSSTRPTQPQEPPHKQ